MRFLVWVRSRSSDSASVKTQIFHDFRIFGFFRDFLKTQIWTQDMRFLVWVRSRSSDPASVKTQIFTKILIFEISEVCD